MDALLETHGVGKSFGGVAALEDVSIAVRPGEILGLIGPNGAGKSTLFNVVSGVIRPDSGQVRLKGRTVTGLAPHRLARLGLTRTFQLAREFDRLTVLETLLLAAPDQPGEKLADLFLRPALVRRAQASAVERAREVLALVGLDGREDALAGELSGGQKKLLELARCLMTGADLVLLDEVGAGVAPALIDRLCSVIERLNAEFGLTFLIIEHNMGVIGRLCHRVTVMAAGRILTEGAFADVRQDARVVGAYLGMAA